jgi:hypothetical protein
VVAGLVVGEALVGEALVGEASAVAVAVVVVPVAVGNYFYVVCLIQFKSCTILSRFYRAGKMPTPPEKCFRGGMGIVPVLQMMQDV